MAISRTEKQAIVENLRAQLGACTVVIVARNKGGMTVASVNNLRKTIREAGGSYMVVKNTLAKIAISGTEYGILDDMLTGPTALAYASDPVALAKVLVEFAKQEESLELCGGVMNGQSLNETAVKMLAALPSLDVLRGKIVGLINAPASKLVGVLQAPGSQLARVLNAYATK